mgnify:CR=1 FL=1
MVVLPLYAVAVWLVVFHFRRRWQAALVIPLSLIPVYWFADLCVWMPTFIAELTGGGGVRIEKNEWLYAVAAAYGALIVLASVIIAVQRRIEPHQCHVCSYDLSGNETGVCPECGAPARCRRCHAELHAEDFRACHGCGAPFPLFAAKHPGGYRRAHGAHRSRDEHESRQRIRELVRHKAREP